MKNIILSIILGFVCMSCTSNKYAACNLSGDWKIDEVLNIKVENTEEEIPFISFQKEEARFYGTTGCNSFFGEFKTKNDTNDIVITNVGSTKKLCADMTVEDAIFSAFIQAASVEYNKDYIFLKDVNGNIIMELSPLNVN